MSQMSSKVLDRSVILGSKKVFTLTFLTCDLIIVSSNSKTLVSPSNVLDSRSKELDEGG